MYRSHITYLHFVLSFCPLCLCVGCSSAPEAKVGSKIMVESRILGEMLYHLARETGPTVVHREGLGGTMIVWRALEKGDIDAYVEYTGTISEEILKGERIAGEEAMQAALARRGIRMSKPLGFNNTYAIGMRRETAQKRGIRTISDLRQHPDLRFGFSNEFRGREDGWPGLQQRYKLKQTDVKSLDHELAYRGIATGSLDATDVYSTDAAIRQYDLQVLTDDLHYFPAYEAVILYRAELEERFPEVVRSMKRLEGAIDDAVMTGLNARVQLDDVDQSEVAAKFINARLGGKAVAKERAPVRRLVQLTGEHLLLVAVSLVAAILLAVPLGIVAARRHTLGHLLLGATGIIQTIPSLALLILLTPWLGLGLKPAVLALFLYSLLPIVRNTYTGLRDIQPSLKESAEALGLSPFARLRLIELPLASPLILAGIKTAAIINVGTATLGGLIGAGGYGQLINEGIASGESGTGLMVQGAAAAAILALCVQGLFELVERLVVPKGLRLRPE
jgi:osmoprotectant transport system permease protein